MVHMRERRRDSVEERKREGERGKRERERRRDCKVEKERGGRESKEERVWGREEGREERGRER